MTFSTSSNRDVVTVSNNEDIDDYKSDDYVNKVFKYFVYELIKNDNDETNILSEFEMFSLINNKLEITENNIETQPRCIKNLYEDVMKLKNNYLFAYYLSRLYENRLLDNRLNSAQKYYDFSEYIIGLNVDFKTLDWSTLKIVKKNHEELYNIYGEKMHRITNEFINKGYIKEITKIENIDEVLKLCLVNAQTKLHDIKISKLVNLQNEFNNLDLLNINNDDSEYDSHDDSDDDSHDDSHDDDSDDDSYYDSDECCEDECCEDECCEEECCEEMDEYDEINQWYYGEDNNKKIKFEELVLNIIQKYEKNNEIKLIDEEIERKHKWDKYVNNIIYNVLKFSIIYCFVSYMFMFYNIITNINNETNHEMNNKIDNIDILMNNLSNSGIINSACTSTKEFVNTNFYNVKPFELQL